jgi:hypothetical protein
MRKLSIRSGLMQNLLIAVILMAAQWAVLTHAFEHDAGKPQNQVCATCVAASQLGFACIDSPPIATPLPAYSVLNPAAAQITRSLHSIVTRQRGPPSSPQVVST